MTVYIEYVILDNVVIDYFLLKAAHKIGGVTAKNSRTLFVSFLGAAVALTVPLLQNAPVVLFAVKILSGFLLVALSASFRSAKEYFLTAAAFLLVTFLTGGALTALFDAFEIPNSSEISVALVFLPALAVIKAVTAAIKVIYRRKTVRAFLYNITLSLNGNNVEAAGFLDTGNGVYDGDSPVIFCDKRLARRLIFSPNFKPAPLKRLSVSTVNGEEYKLCFRIDRLVIYTDDLPNIFNNVTVCVASEGFGTGYDVILHPALFDRKRGAA